MIEQAKLPANKIKVCEKKEYRVISFIDFVFHNSNTILPSSSFKHFNLNGNVLFPF